MIRINPTYQYLQPWLEQLPDTFYSTGEVVYDARNQIRVMHTPDCIEVCVKRFHAPRLLNRIIYTYLRAPKAIRAWENAKRLTTLDIATPTPIAYILCYRHGLLAESYLITIKSPLTRRFYEFREHGIEGYEPVIRQFAQFTAHMHEQQVLHRDYSPGNILFDMDTNGTVHFDLVDINRMTFDQPITPRIAAKNFCRLWGKEDFFTLLSATYAQARGWDIPSFTHQVKYYWKQFWKYRK